MTARMPGDRRLRRSIPWGLFLRAVREAASLEECEETLRRILADGWRPNCSRCDQPVREVWAIAGRNELKRVAFESLDITSRHDPLVRWLCADCTDAVAAALGSAGGPGPPAE